MSTTCKSPRKLMRVVYNVANESLPMYAHHFGPKKLPQPQLYACPILKAWMRRDQRGIADILADSPDPCRAIDLHTVPLDSSAVPASGNPHGTSRKTAVRLRAGWHWRL